MARKPNPEGEPEVTPGIAPSALPPPRPLAHAYAPSDPQEAIDQSWDPRWWWTTDRPRVDQLAHVVGTAEPEAGTREAVERPVSETAWTLADAIASDLWSHQETLDVDYWLLGMENDLLWLHVPDGERPDDHYRLRWGATRDHHLKVLVKPVGSGDDWDDLYQLAGWGDPDGLAAFRLRLYPDGTEKVTAWRHGEQLGEAVLLAGPEA